VKLRANGEIIIIPTGGGPGGNTETKSWINEQGGWEKKKGWWVLGQGEDKKKGLHRTNREVTTMEGGERKKKSREEGGATAE